MHEASCPVSNWSPASFCTCGNNQLSGDSRELKPKENELSNNSEQLNSSSHNEELQTIKNFFEMLKEVWIPHENVCNGVHSEQGQCEGEYYFYRNFAEAEQSLEKLLKQFQNEK